MGQWVNPTCWHSIQMPIQPPALPPPIQLPTSVLGKASEDGPRIQLLPWALATDMGNPLKLLVPGVSLAQPQLVSYNSEINVFFLHTLSFQKRFKGPYCTKISRCFCTEINILIPTICEHLKLCLYDRILFSYEKKF